MSRLPVAREEFEKRLTALREEVARELGRFPRPGPWLLPLAAVAAGFALGWKARGGRPARRALRR